MTVFWYLLFGHLLADFVFKSKQIQHNKISYFAVRAFIYYAVLAICCYKYLSLPWLSFGSASLNGYAAIALAGFVYFGLGILTLANKEWQRSITFFIIRQFILLSILLVIMPVLPFNGDFLHYIYGPDLLFIINACLIVSYVFSDFLVHLAFMLDKYFDVCVIFDRKFLNMLLRIVLLLLIIMPGWFGAAAAAIVLGIIFKSDFYKDDKLYFNIGLAMTVVFGIFCRGIFHGIC